MYLYYVILVEIMPCESTYPPLSLNWRCFKSVFSHYLKTLGKQFEWRCRVFLDGCTAVSLTALLMSSVDIGSRVCSYSHSAAGGFVVQTVAYTTVVRTSDYVLKGRFLQTRTTGSESMNIWEVFLEDWITLCFHKLGIWEDFFTFFNSDLCHFLN